jgi:hypothetical protein
VGVHVAAVAGGREVVEGEVGKTKGVRNEKEEVPVGDLKE